MSLLAYKYYDEIIGLGKYCQLSWYLRTHGLWSGRDFIFDDMVSNNLSSLCDLLETRFENFFVLSNTSTVEFNQFKFFTIKDEANGLFSVHNFKDELDKSSHQKFIEHKKQQIDRLFDAIEEKKSLLFVRVNNPYEKLETTVRLLELLKSIRKGKEFDLYVFQEADFARKIVGMANLFMIYDKEWIWTPTATRMGKWQGDMRLWRNIFGHVRINT